MEKHYSVNSIKTKHVLLFAAFMGFSSTTAVYKVSTELFHWSQYFTMALTIAFFWYFLIKIVVLSLQHQEQEQELYEYKTLSVHDSWELNERIGEFIEDGWEVCGDVVLNYKSSSIGAAVPLRRKL